ncbi:MAG TPA: hypothetical protein VFN35_03420, partial [Ktedonobacteraceae bacterium]|nr:hypothetical protein [Ktedonobacteraceae bacterium]
LIFALFSLIATFRWKRRGEPFTPYQAGVILWSTWFLTLLIFFSAALFDHAYYMVTFAPAICALVGVGCVVMYQAYQARQGWRSWLLPGALTATALVQGAILLVYPELSKFLIPITLGLSLLIAIVLVVVRFVPRFPSTVLVRPFATISLAALLVAPTVWAALPLWAGMDTMNPLAGPSPSLNSLDRLTLLAHLLIPESAHAQPELEQFLLAHQGQARYLVATVNAPTAAPFILDTGRPVVALGGYDGFDQTISVQQVATLIQQGVIRYFLLPQVVALSDGTFIMQPTITRWVAAHCTLVPRSVVEPGSPGSQKTVDLGESATLLTQLFDCAAPR